MEIYLIRHTTPHIEKGICYGQSDIPLADSFQQELDKLLQFLPEKVDVVYSSPLLRCLKLAQLIDSEKEIILDDKLLEMNFGDWELKKWNDIDQQKLNEWMVDFVNVKVPNGENFTELDQRVRIFMNELLNSGYQKIALVTHAGVIRSILVQVLDMALSNAFKIAIDYSSVSKISYDAGTCYKNVHFINKF